MIKIVNVMEDEAEKLALKGDDLTSPLHEAMPGVRQEFGWAMDFAFPDFYHHKRV